jgi:alpha-mannosidase
MKLGNRRSEFTLREAEFWGSIARTLKLYDFSNSTLKSSWIKVLLNQFHDILPGSSIQKVYEEATNAYKKVLADASTAVENATDVFTQNAEAITVFNSLSWDRDVLVELTQGYGMVTIPACGWTTINNNQLIKKTAKKSTKKTIATTIGLENEFIFALFNERGEINSLLDKITGINMLAGSGNRFCLSKDIPARFDT